MSKLDQSKRQGGSLAANRAERVLTQLAAMLAALAGVVNAIGILAFGDVFLASPNANATVLGANLKDNGAVALFAGAMVLCFVIGVTLTTLVTQSAEQFRRTLVLATATVGFCAAYAALYANVAFAPAGLLALSIGAVHCIFERDDVKLQEAMSPTTQLVRFGEELVARHGNAIGNKIGTHLTFWLAFLIGGGVGASAWLALGATSFVLVAGLAGVTAVGTWFAERGFLPSQ